MKSLQESLLDDEDVVIDKLDIKPLIEEWLKKYGIKNYKINKDNTIDVKGDVLLPQHPESKLPSYIQFKKVTGNFYVSGSKLETLEGAPEEVSGEFYCNYCNSLKSLKGCPKEVGGDFSCSRCNSLKSLKGCPKEVGGGFYCNYCNSLKSLEGVPKGVGRNFVCRGCKKLYTTKTDIAKICKVGGSVYL